MVALLNDLPITMPEQNFRSLRFGKRTLNAKSFHDILRRAKSRCVDEKQGYAIDRQWNFNRVARGPRDIGNQGAVCASERIEEARLASIRRASDDDANALLEPFGPWTCEPRLELRRERGGVMPDLFAGLARFILVTHIINRGLGAR